MILDFARDFSLEPIWDGQVIRTMEIISAWVKEGLLGDEYEKSAAHCPIGGIEADR